MRKQSKYRPRAKKNPIQHCTSSFMLLKDYNPAYWTDMVLRLESAYDSMKTGRGNATEFHFIKSAHHIAEAILRVAKGPQDIDGILMRSGVALIEIHTRAQARGSWAMRSDEMAALTDLLSLHNELLEAVNVQQFEQALAGAKQYLLERRAIERKKAAA